MTISDHTNAVVCEIALERERQQTQEGWSTKHDDAHKNGEIAKAAACYALGTCELGGYVGGPEGVWGRITASVILKLWPSEWSTRFWKPKTTRRNLVRAAALLVAEIERLDRANPATPWHGDTP